MDKKDNEGDEGEGAKDGGGEMSIVTEFFRLIVKMQTEVQH